MQALRPLSVGNITLRPAIAPFRGVDSTIALMCREAVSGSKDVLVRRVAEEIISGIYGKDYLSEAVALHYWVSDQRNVRYTRDPAKVELVKSPRKILETRQADCDEAGTLLAAFLLAVGIKQVRFVTGGFNKSAGPHGLSHVFVCFVDPRSGRWCALDPVAGPGTGGMLKRVVTHKDYPQL